MKIESTDPVGVCFNMMKIRYQTYDAALMDTDFLQPTDKINVFLNLETVLKYISTVQDLEKKMMVCSDIDKILVSNTINLAAHYKDFFRGNGLDTNIFLYMTDLSSTSPDFEESRYNEDFRSYYINKYMGNPKFVLLGSKLKDTILPEVKTICEYIPQVYFISKQGIDSGLIPYIISEKYPDRKNIVLSGDLYDTQYSYNDNFLAQLYLRGWGLNVLANNVSQYIKAITKSDTIPDTVLNIFKNASFYKLLLCCIGDRYRSVDGVSGIKFAKLVSSINSALSDGKITENTTSAELLSEIFPDSVKKGIYQNLVVMDLHSRLKMIGEGCKKDITSQIIDKVDRISVMKLNSSIFVKHPLWLEALYR